MNTENRSRFVLLCQQALACAVVVAVAAPAAGIVTLDSVAPSPGAGATAAVAGALVASAPVEDLVARVGPVLQWHLVDYRPEGAVGHPLDTRGEPGE